MTFTVTYRGADGAVVTEAVEAASRRECFAQMKARGITPMGVKEGNFVSRRGRRAGGTGSRADRVEPGKGKDGRVERVDRVERIGEKKSIPHSHNSTISQFHNSTIKASLLLIALVVLAGGVAWWWWMVGGHAGRVTLPEPEAPKKADALPKEVTPAPAPTAPANPAAAAQTNEAAVAEKKPKERHDTISIHTNNLGKVVEKWIGPDGKKHMSVRYARKPVFDNASDDQLAMAVSGGGTQAIAPIPMTATSEQEFLESLKKPIVINDDDPENVKRIKEAVKEAREAMKQLMDGGMSYREALAEHQKLVNENVETRNQCMAELKQLVDAGDREGAEHYLKTMNVALEQMGIPALTMPMSREELNAARRKRREEREAAKRNQP